MGCFSTASQTMRFIITAVVRATIIYIACLLIFIENIEMRAKADFANLTKTIELSKGRVFLIARDLETLISHKDISMESQVASEQWHGKFENLTQWLLSVRNKTQGLSQQSFMYEVELYLLKELDFLLETLPSLAPQEDKLFYRSYLSGNAFEHDDKNIIYDPNCEFTDCVTGATEYSLADKILVTRVMNKNNEGKLIHYDKSEDTIDNPRLLTLSSPIFFGKRIIGDISIDLYLDRFEVFNISELSQYEVNRSVFTVITPRDTSFSEVSISFEYYIDNRNVLVFKLPIFYIFYKYLVGFISILIIVSFIMAKSEELRDRNSQLKETKREGLQDFLTGAYNRKIMDDLEFTQAIFKHEQGALIMLDGDGFKLVNDKYGHNMGDEAIKAIASCAFSQLRKSDYLVRMGGDEFLLVLPGMNKFTAMEWAQKLSTAISNYKLPRNVSISVSFGISEFSPDSTMEAAIELADCHLYANKAKKREASSLTVVNQLEHKS
ncbi:two-component response regulator and GGDEF family protein YeaJ [Vibrio orientalis CIP 102891 = ATCC 33934]|uniref:diguanylate cyclase n=1 Tax=Vibrio orientalis CIP 102891 = ATCC 33934 TaxID=675816 RepID=C9QHJ9_VIBOR|nr:GGDEF domain-containing protein [Vibrio orientalis]EEX93730.1 putative two-component response regulator and GGDEF family protein YeaJ [Vibrio orientalis CIP 102891 = ATCC 33934]EGU50737.1 two-component response regulator and GGDEF family protein YeaJ [Vibrio orientalis CIP 102891 = ATCC 33934]